MQIRMLEVFGRELAIVWDDGHESYYPLEALRRACPCAYCAGEPDLFGNISRGPDPNYTPASFEVRGLDRIGNYGLQIRWADGHAFGIWTIDDLRKRCPCADCTAAGTPPA